MTDRPEKWKGPLSPGYVIPAGQPYMIEFGDNLYGAKASQLVRSEFVGLKDRVVDSEHPANTWFVDSSWKPPLDLPTEPTWGIALLVDGGRMVRRWYLDGEMLTSHKGARIGTNAVLDFIPLTPEQVARIEAAR